MSKNNCKYLFFRDRDNEHSIGRRQAGEKVLDLPARSRFGEGRAEPLRE
jgi:hypothetical protein